MWNNIANGLRDPGLGSARAYIAAKPGVNNARCVFHKGRFGVMGANYVLYVLAHGCDNAAEMASGKWYNGREQPEELFWRAPELASALVSRGLRGDVAGRIRLCLCYSGKPHRGIIFAQQLAIALHKVGRGVHSFAQVIVGGFVAPVNWSAGKRNQDDRSERVSRTYYRCDIAGSPVNKYGLEKDGERWCYFPFDYLEGPY